MIVWEWYENRRQSLLAAGLKGNVLDIGYAEMPNPFFGPSTLVTGVDLVESESVPGYARQLVGDFAQSSEIEFEKFDAVVAGEVLEHVENPYKFLRAAYQCLVVGGEIRVSTPNAIGLPALFYEVARSQKRFFAEDHKYYFTPRWVVKMLHDVGFQEVGATPVGLWLPGVPLPWSPTILAYQIVYSGRRCD